MFCTMCLCVVQGWWILDRMLVSQHPVAQHSHWNKVQVIMTMRASLYKGPSTAKSWKQKVQTVTGSMNLVFDPRWNQRVSHSESSSRTVKAVSLQGCPFNMPFLTCPVLKWRLKFLYGRSKICPTKLISCHLLFWSLRNGPTYWTVVLRIPSQPTRSTLVLFLGKSR